MRECDCGAYRLAEKVDGEWVWAAGCKACDKIERQRILLEGGVRVYRGESPERLRERVETAECEVENLRRQEKEHAKKVRRAFRFCPHSGGSIPDDCPYEDEEHDLEVKFFDDEECDCPACTARRLRVN